MILVDDINTVFPKTSISVPQSPKLIHWTPSLPYDMVIIITLKITTS